jgi:hypothetical protein
VVSIAAGKTAARNRE